MSLKNYMHPRNIYKVPPNFKELAIAYPEFRKYAKQELSGKVTIDYQDSNAVAELSKTLLMKDFNLKVEIAKDRLIPRVPLCMNYILWVEDLLGTLNLKDRPVGIDIGTGSVGIYSLLAARKGWKMLATEIDETNLKMAENNLRMNALKNEVTLKLVDSPEKILIDVIDQDSTYDFCMCNPPFFDFNEKFCSRNPNRPNPKSVASNVTSEIITTGGEVAFVTKLIKESKVLKDRVKVYTSLIGKKADFLSLKDEIMKLSPNQITVTEFCQGRTTRWGLAWTFLDVDIKNATNNLPQKIKKGKLKRPLSHIINKLTTAITMEDAAQKVKNIMSTLMLTYTSENFNEYVGFKVKAYQNTWSHQRRKKRENRTKTESASTEFLSISEKEDVAPKSKKIKLNEESSESCFTDNESEKTLITEFCILLKEESNSITLELPWLSGNKESIHQILQYIKNNWNNTN